MILTYIILGLVGLTLRSSIVGAILMLAFNMLLWAGVPIFLLYQIINYYFL